MRHHGIGLLSFYHAHPGLVQFCCNNSFYITFDFEHVHVFIIHYNWPIQSFNLETYSQDKQKIRVNSINKGDCPCVHVWERFSMSREYNFEIWCLLHFQICNRHHSFWSVSTEGKSSLLASSLCYVKFMEPVNIDINT